jgi:hypothetical protein
MTERLKCETCGKQFEVWGEALYTSKFGVAGIKVNEAEFVRALNVVLDHYSMNHSEKAVASYSPRLVGPPLKPRSLSLSN